MTECARVNHSRQLRVSCELIFFLPVQEVGILYAKARTRETTVSLRI